MRTTPGQPAVAARPRGLARVLVALLVAVTALVAVPTTAAPTHGAFVPSSGIYRVPYADGTMMTVGRDHHQHTPVDRIDMTAGFGTPVVAAASGWLHGSACQRPGESGTCIIDHHGNTNGLGDGLASDGTTPQNDNLEHTCGNNDDANTVTGSCASHNNYVWLEHPNGEWTKYTHMATGSVSALGWQHGDWVDAGDTLGLESDIGQASTMSGMGSANHLHFQVSRPPTPGTDLTWASLGGEAIGEQDLVPVICDLPAPGFLIDDASYTAGPCTNIAPTADAGGPYVVDEGADVVLDGGGSLEPDGNQLSYLWTPETAPLDDTGLAQPTYTGVDDSVDVLTLTVYDQVEQLDDSDTTTVTVQNVAPTVTAVGDVIDEGGSASVSATFTDPGTEDEHDAVVDWGDGSAPQLVDVGTLAAGVSHVYGDNGSYQVSVTVTDDDGGAGADTVDVLVGNLDPSVTADTSGEVAFPGGDFLVVEAGEALPVTAQAGDAGSDDLTFTWSTGEVTTYFNDGTGPDPLPSPGGTFPFAAVDDAVAEYALPGLEQVVLTVHDDDGGSAAAGSGVLVTGTAEATRGSGWWKHQYSGAGGAHLPAEVLAGYLEVVAAASGVFSEQTVVVTADDAHAVLSPTGGDRRARAEAALLSAWLQFGSGAVDVGDTVPLGDGTAADFLGLMAGAETVILDGGATPAELDMVRLDLQRVRHAG